MRFVLKASPCHLESSFYGPAMHSIAISKLLLVCTVVLLHRTKTQSEDPFCVLIHGFHFAAYLFHAPEQHKNGEKQIHGLNSQYGKKSLKQDQLKGCFKEAKRNDQSM